MKKHKEISISYDVVDNRVENVKFTGDQKELSAALCWGGQEIFDAAANAVLRYYLECPSREAFLSSFLGAAAQMDAEAIKAMQKTNKTVS